MLQEETNKQVEQVLPVTSTAQHLQKQKQVFSNYRNALISYTHKKAKRIQQQNHTSSLIESDLFNPQY